MTNKTTCRTKESVIQLNICDYTVAGQTNCTGHADGDYPSLETSIPSLADLHILKHDQHVPLPPELIEEFQSIHKTQYNNYMTRSSPRSESKPGAFVNIKPNPFTLMFQGQTGQPILFQAHTCWGNTACIIQVLHCVNGLQSTIVGTR